MADLLRVCGGAINFVTGVTGYLEGISQNIINCRKNDIKKCRVLSPAFLVSILCIFIMRKYKIICYYLGQETNIFKLLISPVNLSSTCGSENVDSSSTSIFSNPAERIVSRYFSF